MKSTPIFAAIIVCLFCIGCRNSTPKQFTERKLVIKNKETVRIAEIELQITNNGCGRKWVSEGDQPSFEKPYCDIVIKRRDSVIHAGSGFDPVYIGNISITIDRMNPWGREEDSIPPCGCRLWVRRVEGR